MKQSMKLFLFAVLLGLATFAIWGTPAQATTFSFTDEYYVSTQAQFNTIFGTGTAGYVNAGIYQEVNTSVPTVYELRAGGGFSTIPGEFVPNTNTGIVITGWSENNSTNGSQVMTSARFTGYTLPLLVNSGATASIQYKTGITTAAMTNGTAAAFNLISIDLRTYPGTASGYTITGSLGGVVKDTATMATNGLQNGVDGSGYIYGATVPFNWTDIDTVTFTLLGPAGTLVMDNIDITPYTASVPEPATLLLIGSGMVGIAAFRKRFKKS